MCCRVQVALHPEWTIVACVLLTLLSCIGIVNFSPKSDTLSLWIPETSVRSNVIVVMLVIQSKLPPTLHRIFNIYSLCGDGGAVTQYFLNNEHNNELLSMSSRHVK